MIRISLYGVYLFEKFRENIECMNWRKKRKHRNNSYRPFKYFSNSLFVGEFGSVLRPSRIPTVGPHVGKWNRNTTVGHSLIRNGRRGCQLNRIIYKSTIRRDLYKIVEQVSFRKSTLPSADR